MRSIGPVAYFVGERYDSARVTGSLGNVQSLSSIEVDESSSIFTDRHADHLPPSSGLDKAQIRSTLRLNPSLAFSGFRSSPSDDNLSIEGGGAGKNHQTTPAKLCLPSFQQV